MRESLWKTICVRRKLKIPVRRTVTVVLPASEIASSASQPLRFQAGETMAVKVPAIVMMPPGPNVRLECLFEDRLKKIPTAIVVKPMWDEPRQIQLIGRRLIPDGNDWFEQILIGMQQKQRWPKGNANQRLVCQRA